MCSSLGQAFFTCCWLLPPLTGVNHSITWMKTSPGVQHYMEWYKKIRTRPVSYFKANFSIKLQQSKENFFNLISSLKLLFRVLACGVRQTSFDEHWAPFCQSSQRRPCPAFSCPQGRTQNCPSPSRISLFLFPLCDSKQQMNKKLFAAVISTHVFTALEIHP